MNEIYDGYAMDKDEAHFVIDMYFVKKNGEKQHKTLSWSNGKWNGVREFYSLADLKEMDALEILFDDLPPVFRDNAKKLVLSQYESRSAWVPVTIGLPEEEGDYLIALETPRGIEVHEAYFFRLKWYDPVENYEVFEPIYWRQMPKPPKEFDE